MPVTRVTDKSSPADRVGTSTRGRASTSGKRNIVIVGVATYFFWVSLFLYVPILPLHARELGANLEMVGIVIASYGIGQFIFRIPIGAGSDIIGRKPFAVGALILSGVGAIWLAQASGPWPLFAARTLTGVAAAGWVAISVLFASYYPSNNTSRAMAVIMLVNTLSLVSATFVGGIMAEYFGNSSTFYASAGIGFAGALLILAAPEPRIVSATRYSFSTALSVLKSPLLLRISAIAIILQFVSFAVNFGFLPIHAENLGASKSEIGYITTAGLLTAVAGTLLSAWVVAKWGPTTAVVIAAIATFISLVLMTMTTDLLTLGGLQALNGFGRGMMLTVLIGLALVSAPVAVRATAMGSFQALYSIGMLLGPVISGPIAFEYGIEMVFWTAAGATVVGGVLVVVKPLPRSV